MEKTYLQLINIANSKLKENKKLINDLKRNKPKNLDEIFQKYHHQAFELIDCLKFANCCKHISPPIKPHDLPKLAKVLKIKTSEIVKQYMHIDEDHDYVFNTCPCPFLLGDNHCSVYKERPTACREYPHTNSPKVYRLLDLCLKNSTICPAVSYIFEKLKTENF